MGAIQGAIPGAGLNIVMTMKTNRASLTPSNGTPGAGTPSHWAPLAAGPP
jgi:hypothetical protein